MATLARSVKGGGGTTIADGQTFRASDVDPDMVSLFVEANGELDDQNVKTAEAPGAKSWRYTELSSAPSSPGANDLVVYAFDVGSTTTLRAKDSGGTLISLSGLGARVYNDADQNLANNTATALAFNSERYDVGAFHDAGANTKLTAPVAGKYLITGHARFAAPATNKYTQIQVSLRVNGTTAIADNYLVLTFTAATLQTQSIATIYSLAASDYVELVALQVNTDLGGEGGQALPISAVGNHSPEFAIAYLGN